MLDCPKGMRTQCTCVVHVGLGALDGVACLDGSAQGPMAGLSRRLSVAVTAVTTAAMSLLFVLMQLVTDHSDTWWNADGVWAVGSWGVLWMSLKRVKGTRPEDLKTERQMATLWTAMALGSVLILPALRSGLTWGEATVWPSVGMCLAAVLQFGLRFNIGEPE